MGINKRMWIAGLSLAFLLSLLFGLYARRNDMVASYVSQKIQWIEGKTGVRITFDCVLIDDIRTLKFSDLHVYNIHNDTILTIEDVRLKLNLLNFFSDKKYIESVWLDKVDFQLDKAVKLHGGGAILDNKGKKTDDIRRKFESLAKVYSVATQYLPRQISISECNLYAQNDSSRFQFYFPTLQFAERRFLSQLLIKEFYRDSISEMACGRHYVVDCQMGESPEDLSKLKIYSLENNGVTLPFFLKKRFDVDANLDTMTTVLSVRLTNVGLKLKGSLQLDSLRFYQRRICSDTIRCRNMSCDLSAEINDESVKIDSTSAIRMNGLPMFFYFDLHQISDTAKSVCVEIHNDQMDAQQFFDAFPECVCRHLHGMEVGGSLGFRCRFKMETDKVDSLEFSSAMTPKEFVIHKFGETDFRKVSNPFVYHVFEDGIEVDDFVVGDENPDFVKADAVSPYLRHSILYSEDGFFFSHKGFYDEAFRSSLVKNIKEKKFVRGGSTISMQLVKNLWLSKEKTLSRKVEEELIVWLIENKRLLTKERMFEIYLNIIEWGPHIYGVKDAARFYFDKQPSDLNIEESIFMASIIPRPKKFMWSFDERGNLKPYLEPYFQTIGQKLLKHEIITEAEFERIKPNVLLKGRATSFLKTAKNRQEEVELEMDDDDGLDFLGGVENIWINDENSTNESNTGN